MSINLIDGYFENQDAADVAFNEAEWDGVDLETEFSAMDVVATELQASETAIEVMDACLEETEALIAQMSDDANSTPGRTYTTMMRMVGMEGFDDNLGLEGLKEKAAQLYKTIAEFIANMVRTARKWFDANITALGRAVKAASKLKALAEKMPEYNPDGSQMVRFGEIEGKHLINIRTGAITGSGAGLASFNAIADLLKYYKQGGIADTDLKEAQSGMDDMASNGAVKGEAMGRVYGNLGILMANRIMGQKEKSEDGVITYMSKDGIPGGRKFELRLPISAGMETTKPTFKSLPIEKNVYVPKAMAMSKKEIIDICGRIVAMGKDLLDYKRLNDKELEAVDKLANTLKSISIKADDKTAKKHAKMLRTYMSLFTTVSRTVGEVVGRGLMAWYSYAKKSYKLGVKSAK